MSLLEDMHNQIETAFKEHPYRFFTEHDIHSELALIATRLLKSEGNLFAKTREELMISRIHHEYPTPFRCLMKGSQFKVITEAEFRAERLKDPKFRAMRGRIDLVIFNPEYVSSNKLRVVSGKRYRDFRESLEDERLSALELAIEVVYFPVFDRRPHLGIMKRRVDSAIQDYKKLVALMEFTYSEGIPFCKEAALMFFSNTPHKDKMKKMLSSVPLHNRVSFFPIMYLNAQEKVF